MDERLSTAFLNEIRVQCFCARQAYDSVRTGLALRRDLMAKIEALRPSAQARLPVEATQAAELTAELTNETIQLLTHVQSFLAAAEVLSSIFWPILPGPGVPGATPEEERARSLKERLGVGEGSPLRIRPDGPEDVRRSLHRVERLLVDFAGHSPEGPLPVFDVGRLPSRRTHVAGGALRTLDERTMVLRVNGRDLDLDALMNEIQRVGSQISIRARLSWRGLRDAGLVLPENVPIRTGSDRSAHVPGPP